MFYLYLEQTQQAYGAHSPMPGTTVGGIAAITWVRGFALVFFTAALSGCMSRPPSKPSIAAVPVAGDIQCQVEKVTGSLFTVRICRTKAERDARQSLTDQMKNGLDRQRSIACPNGNAPPCKPF